jgi:hypothetical protein
MVEAFENMAISGYRATRRMIDDSRAGICRDEKKKTGNNLKPVTAMAILTLTRRSALLLSSPHRLPSIPTRNIGES